MQVLNVREANHKQIMENKEICDLVKIVGLQYKKKYTTMEDLKSLRYGKIMIMTDQDQDGSHIKGLLINFIHHNWPELLRMSFLEEFITPIVKATKGERVHNFYSQPEFNEWKAATENWHTWKIKYYKGTLYRLISDYLNNTFCLQSLERLWCKIYLTNAFHVFPSRFGYFDLERGEGVLFRHGTPSDQV